MTAAIRKISAAGRVTVSAPPSKSAAHRLLILAALADGKSEIVCRGSSADIDATIGCLNAMGADIVKSGDRITVRPVVPVSSTAELDVGESGSTLRFMLPVLGALGITARIKMHGRLPERPLEPLWSELIAHGMTMRRSAADELTVSGKLIPGNYSIDGGVSSQFITGLLFALPCLPGESRLDITGKRESVPYIEMTLAAQRRFGCALIDDGAGFTISACPYHAGAYAVEGDYSGAAFMLCAGALTDAGVLVTGLTADSTQGDREILHLLREFGAEVTEEAEGIRVCRGNLRGMTVDARDIPDLVPIVSVIAAAAEGCTEIINAGRLRLKESDRLTAVADLLTTLGAQVEEKEDSLTIRGGKPLHGGLCNGYNDHRIVMSAAVAALICDGEVEITTPNAVAKSYPEFYEDLARFGLAVRKDH